VLRSVLTRTLRDAGRGLVWWSVGIGAYVLLTVSVYPSIKDNADLERAVKNYPEALKAFVGGELDLTSGPGYLDAELFSLMVPLLLLVYAIGAGARGIAGEEEAGTLELLLSHPISRTRLTLEKAAAMTLQIGVLAFAAFAVVAAGAKLVSMEIGAGRIAAACLAVYLLALGHGSVALLVGAATGKRALAIGVSSALAVAGYMLDGLSRIVGALEPWRVLSPFDWMGDPLRKGVDLRGTAALLALALGAAALAPLLFDRRDIAV
jgi:ABC-2 type transport system permease protein